MSQRPVNITSNTPAFLKFLGDVVNNASQLPADLRDFSDKLNSDYIKFGQTIQNQQAKTAAEVEDNLKNYEVARVGGVFTEWLSEPVNLITSFLGVVTVVLVAKSMKKK